MELPSPLATLLNQTINVKQSRGQSGGDVQHVQVIHGSGFVLKGSSDGLSSNGSQSTSFDTFAIANDQCVYQV